MADAPCDATTTDHSTAGTDETIKSEVRSAIDDAKRLAKLFTFDDIESGDWFVSLLQKVIRHTIAMPQPFTFNTGTRVCPRTRLRTNSFQ